MMNKLKLFTLSLFVVINLTLPQLSYGSAQFDDLPPEIRYAIVKTTAVE